MTIIDTAYGNAFMKRLRELRSTQCLTDVRLSNGEIKFACHKVVLAAASDFFKAKFTSEMQDVNVYVDIYDVDFVNVIGTDSNTLQLIVSYIYSMEIELTMENVKKVVQAANQFALHNLLDLCDKFMVEEVSGDNALEMYLFANRYHLNDLLISAWDVMKQNFDCVVRSKEFCSMTKDDILKYFSEVQDLVNPKDKMFDAACTWVQFDTDQRKSSFSKLLDCVQLSTVSLAYLADTVLFHPLIAETNSRLLIQNIIKENFGHLNPTSAISSAQANLSKGYGTGNCISEPVLMSLVKVGGKHGNCNDTSVVYWTSESEWQTFTHMPKSLELFSVVTIPSGILVTGGRTVGDNGAVGNALYECHLYNLALDKWESFPPMTYGRRNHGSVLHEGNVYVAGGREGETGSLTTVEVYNMEQGQWQEGLNLMRDDSDRVHLASCGHHLFLTYAQSCQIHVCKPTRNTGWHTIELYRMNSFLGFSVLHDNLYVLAEDHLSQKRFSVYNFKAQVFTQVADDNANYFDAPITSYQGKLVGVNRSGLVKYKVTVGWDWEFFKNQKDTAGYIEQSGFGLITVNRNVVTTS